MILRLIRLAAFGAAGVTTTLASALPVGAEDLRVRTYYTIYWKGLPVAETMLDGQIVGTRYSVLQTSRTRGLLKLMVRARSRSTVRGVIVDGRLRPRVYQARGTFKSQPYDITVRFGPGGSTQTLILPPNANRNWSAVPSQLRRGVTDPLTVAFARVVAMRLGSSAKPGRGGSGPLASGPAGAALYPFCGGAARVYDGRRRFDSAPAYAGAGPRGRQRCVVTDKRLAGFHVDHDRAEKVSRLEFSAVRVRSAKIWVALRLRIGTRFGTMIARLRRVEVAQAGRALRPIQID